MLKQIFHPRIAEKNPVAPFSRLNAFHAGAISRKTFIWIGICLGVPLFLVVFFSGLRWNAQRTFERKRIVWKDATLARIAKLSVDDERIGGELATLKNDIQKEPASFTGISPWVSDDVLLMKNGEFLFYAFWHGFNDGLVNHLFLAHGSNGRWYYSTYHFCNQMCTVLTHDPPASIDEFAKRYAVREFDGHSDECLKKTCRSNYHWLPAPNESAP